MVMKTKDESGNKILNNFQIENLRRHVYKSSGSTILDPYMQIYWRWLVERVPLWVAPNMLTLVGLCINVGTSVPLIYHSADSRSTAPSSAFIACGVGLFLYQSLDAIDGKHARRTGTNGPLGEIFDHGCDAFSTVFVLIAYGIATDLGPTIGLFTLCCLGNFLFYAAHWQTLVSGILNFGRCDVTEAQLFLISVHIWTGLFGPGLWNYEPIEGIPIKYMMLASSTVCSFGSFIASGNAATILTGGSGKNGATIADTSVLSPGIPVLLLSGMFWKLMTESPTQVFESNAVLFVLTMGLAFTKVTNSLVVAHMTKSPPTVVVDSIMLGPALLLINQYLSTPVNETLLLTLVLVFTAYDSIRYCVEICREICAGLDVPCLTMPSNVKLVNPPSDISPSKSSRIRLTRSSTRSSSTVASSRSGLTRVARRTDSGSGTSMSDKN